MTSLRHQHAIARIKHDAHRLTPDERAKIGLPARPRLRHIHPSALPSNPADFVWFALTTTTRGEPKAVEALCREGFAAFNPTEVVEMRASRRAKFRRRDRERAILTSTVLAGFRGRWVNRRVDGEMRDVFHADVPWLTVLRLPRITGVIGMGDGPVRVPLGNVLVLQERCGQRAPTRNWAAKVGDEVEVSWGAFAGQTGTVVELADGAAKVALFGATGLLASLAEPLEVPEQWVNEIEHA